MQGVLKSLSLSLINVVKTEQTHPNGLQDLNGQYRVARLMDFIIRKSPEKLQPLKITH